MTPSPFLAAAVCCQDRALYSQRCSTVTDFAENCSWTGESSAHHAALLVPSSSCWALITILEECTAEVLGHFKQQSFIGFGTIVFGAASSSRVLTASQSRSLTAHAVLIIKVRHYILGSVLDGLCCCDHQAPAMLLTQQTEMRDQNAGTDRKDLTRLDDGRQRRNSSGGEMRSRC
jgi:hypothetical protein